MRCRPERDLAGAASPSRSTGRILPQPVAPPRATPTAKWSSTEKTTPTAALTRALQRENPGDTRPPSCRTWYPALQNRHGITSTGMRPSGGRPMMDSARTSGTQRERGSVHMDGFREGQKVWVEEPDGSLRRRGVRRRRRDHDLRLGGRAGRVQVAFPDTRSGQQVALPRDHASRRGAAPVASDCTATCRSAQRATRSGACRLDRSRRRLSRDRLRTVQLHRTPGELQFSVRDTGCGFDPRTATRGKGLASLHDRVDTVGGHIDVGSAPGRGTTVTGTVPWPPRTGVGSSDPDDASDLDGWDRPAHQPAMPGDETKRE